MSHWSKLWDGARGLADPVAIAFFLSCCNSSEPKINKSRGEKKVIQHKAVVVHNGQPTTISVDARHPKTGPSQRVSIVAGGSLMGDHSYVLDPSGMSAMERARQTTAGIPFPSLLSCPRTVLLPPSVLPLSPHYASRLLGRTCSSLLLLSFRASGEVNQNKPIPITGTYLFMWGDARRILLKGLNWCPTYERAFDDASRGEGGVVINSSRLS